MSNGLRVLKEELAAVDFLFHKICPTCKEILKHRQQSHDPVKEATIYSKLTESWINPLPSPSAVSYVQ